MSSETGRTEVVVGRIGRPHGVRGELSVEPRTDEPDRRFTPGARLLVRAAQGSARVPLAAVTVAAVRWHQERLLVRFEEVGDRTAAEGVRGLLLATEVSADETPEDPDEFYDHQLVGLHVVTTEGAEVGEVTEVLHAGAQDLLVIAREGRADALVPFVTALVPEVDLDSGRLVVADRPGLLEPDQAELAGSGPDEER